MCEHKTLRAGASTLVINLVGFEFHMKERRYDCNASGSYICYVLRYHYQLVSWLRVLDLASYSNTVQVCTGQIDLVSCIERAN
jgi:hypothetical protein